MISKMVGVFADCGISLFAGVYATLLDHRKVGRRPGESFKYDQWHDLYGRMFRVVGPFLILLSLLRLLWGLSMLL